MRISKVNINCRQEKPINTTDYCFLFFKTPLFFRVDKSEKLFPEKTAVICKNNTPHFYRSANENPVVFDYVSFKMTVADQQYFTSLELPLNKPIRLSEDIVIQNVLKSILAEELYSGKRKNEFAEYALKLIFINMSEQLQHENIIEKMNTPHYKELKELHEKIISEPLNHWNITEICKSMNIGRAYFHRIYFSAFGATFMQDAIRSKLAYAENMLLNTNDSIGRIAELCDYDNDSYFMRQFKKHYGYTPTEYRRRFSSNESINITDFSDNETEI